MEQQKRVAGDSVGFNLKPKGERKDCRIELEVCKDFGNLRLSDIQMGQGNASLLSLRQMVKNGRPVVVIIMPPGQQFSCSTANEFMDSMKRIGIMKPIIMVFGGK
jgi:hypothetical protein